jgi:hypothetical protein
MRVPVLTLHNYVNTLVLLQTHVSTYYTYTYYMMYFALMFYRMPCISLLARFKGVRCQSSSLSLSKYHLSECLVRSPACLRPYTDINV